MPPQRQHDPTLPRPWELLFDPASGLKYYWNPTTNVTQYERPAGGPPPVLPAPGAAAPAAAASYVSLTPFSARRSSSLEKASVRNSVTHFDLDLQGGTNGYASNGGMAHANGNGNASLALPASQQSFSMSCEAYRAEHQLIVQGDRVPVPLQTFEAAGFSSSIMDEVYTPDRMLHASLLARGERAGVGWPSQPVGIEAMARLPACEARMAVLSTVRAC